MFSFKAIHLGSFGFESWFIHIFFYEKFCVYKPHVTDIFLESFIG